MKHRFAFPKQEKLTGETAVNELFLKGRSLMVYPMRIVWNVSPSKTTSSLKVLMSVPKKKLKKAVDRNRVKRLMREAYRLHNQALVMYVEDCGIDVQIAFVWIPNEVLDFDKVERKTMDALQKMQLLLEQNQLDLIDSNNV